MDFKPRQVSRGVNMDIGDVIQKAEQENKTVYIDLETFKKIGNKK